MGPSIALLALFLLVLVAVALAAARLAGARDASGRRQLSGILASLAVGVGLLVLGFLGLLVFAGAMGLQTTATLVERNPIERIYLGTAPEAQPRYASHVFAAARALDDDLEGYDSYEPYEDRPAFQRDPRRPLHVIFELRGHHDSPPGMLAWLEEWTDGEARVSVTPLAHTDGSPVTVVDVALPAERHDLREIERAARKLIPGASWARGLHVEMRGARRDW